MKAAATLFYKTLVLNYYIRNAVFLLIILLFAFGFLSGVEHMAIIRSIISSPKSFLYVITLWLVYDCAIITFVLKQLNIPTFRILYHLQLFSKRNQLLVLAKTQFNLLHLTNFYAVFIIFVSMLDGIYWPVYLIIIYKIAAVLVASFIYSKRIALPLESNLFSINLNISFLPKTKTYFGAYFSGYLINNYALTFLVIKAFSILLLNFFFWLYPTDAYDFRLFGLAAIILTALNVKLIQLYFEFEKTHLQYTFNLPFTFLQRFGYYAINIFWVLLPEVIAFVWKSKSILEPNQIIGWSVFYFFLLLLISELMFYYQENHDRAFQILFFIMVFLSLLIMYKSSLLLLSIFLIAATLVLFSQKVNHKKRDL